MPDGCGPCTLCCTVMKVDMEPPKPERTPCAHCTVAGCSIYARRPEPCRVFQCVWLYSQDKPEPLPRSLRPDRCGVVLEGNSVGAIVVHSHRPGGWRRQPLFAWLKAVAARTRVLVENGAGVQLLHHTGSVEPLEFFGVSPETNERLYRRRVTSRKNSAIGAAL